MRRIKALIDGAWHGSLEETDAVRTRLKAAPGFRDRVTADGATAFPAAPGRYHLYVSYACPWAHRTIIYRRLKGLEDVISMSVLHPRWAGENGWRFARGPLGTVDHVAGRRYLHDVYVAADPCYTGRVTVPVLWDKKTGSIVNNQSADIVRMLNNEFDAWGDRDVDFYPAELKSEIDSLNRWLLADVCAGVYRAGFASTQADHDKSVTTLFRRLDELEARMAQRPYLLGDRLTESDWHLFATLCRFDAVYVGALRCNIRRLIDYPALRAYTRRLHALPGVAETVRFDHIKAHYYDAIEEIDRTIMPLGPAVDYSNA